MADFLDDPTIKCHKHEKAFQPEKCGECATLVTLNARIKLLTDINDAYEQNDVVKLRELHKTIETQIIIDEGLNGK